jgi:PIN domain nuclease of toxin-antitoxin system
VLLDTHVWLWAVTDEQRRLGRKTRRVLDKAATARSLYLSTASLFEVAALHTGGRLHLRLPVEAWIRMAVAAGPMRLVDLTPDIAIDAGLIPAASVPDPLDRVMIASARNLDLPLLTADRKLLAYGEATGFARFTDASL